MVSDMVYGQRTYYKIDSNSKNLFQIWCIIYMVYLSLFSLSQATQSYIHLNPT